MMKFLFGALLVLPALPCVCTAKWPDVQADTFVQLDASPVDVGPTAADNASRRGGRCPLDMVEARGSYCPQVEQKCLRWLDEDQRPEAHGGIGPMRCAEFAPSRCLSKTRVDKDFCLDRYEWPNVEGELPSVDVTWHQAKAACENAGKRLCTSSEWTFACEGEEMRPYPYGDGLHRDESACDQTHEPMPVGTPRSRWPEFYQGHRSGSELQCTSPFGAYDMVAGVDEFVVNESGRPYVSGLMGGYGSKLIRARCRPITTAHNEFFSYYQIGFRCCKSI